MKKNSPKFAESAIGGRWDSEPIAYHVNEDGKPPTRPKDDGPGFP